MAEDDNLAGRVRRYARVGAAVSGLAARLAGERYLGVKLDRDRHAADLAAALGVTGWAKAPGALPGRVGASIQLLSKNWRPIFARSGAKAA